MQIPGHLAIAVAQHRFISIYEPDAALLKPLLLASLFPDMVDKAIGYVFHAMPNGRHYTHNLFSLVLLSGAVALLWGKRAGYAWFIGHLGHLLADTGPDQMVPWFFPLKSYHFSQSSLKFEVPQLTRETIFLLLVFVVYRLST